MLISFVAVFFVVGYFAFLFVVAIRQVLAEATLMLSLLALIRIFCFPKDNQQCHQKELQSEKFLGVG